MILLSVAVSEKSIKRKSSVVDGQEDRVSAYDGGSDTNGHITDAKFETNVDSDLLIGAAKIIPLSEESVAINDHVTEEELHAYLQDVGQQNVIQNAYCEIEDTTQPNEAVVDEQETDSGDIEQRCYTAGGMLENLSVSENLGLISKQEIDWKSTPAQSNVSAVDQELDGPENPQSSDPEQFFSKTLDQFVPAEEAGETLEHSEQGGVEESTELETPATVITIIDKSEEAVKSNKVKPMRQLATVTPVDEALPDWKPTESELQLGQVQPDWIPDEDSQICMLCEAKFTMLRRRHHCRACGRVLCADCCHFKSKLPYIDKKEVRICHSCSDRLQKIADYRNKRLVCETAEASNSVLSSSSGTVPQPPVAQLIDSSIAPSEPASRSTLSGGDSGQEPPDPIQLVRGSLSRSSSQGVLKQRANRRELKNVMFCDGVRPGTEQVIDKGSSVVRLIKKSSSHEISLREKELESYLCDTGRYLICGRNDSDEWVTWKDIEDLLVHTDKEISVVKFALKRNLKVVCSVSKNKMMCHFAEVIFCKQLLASSQWPGAYLCTFASDGMKNVCTDELFIAIVCEMEDDDQAEFKSAFQMTITSMLRFFDKLYGTTLAAYPWPVICDPRRKAVLHCGGHTIMNILNDFRNFTYNIASVTRSAVVLEENTLRITLPTNQISQVRKIVQCSNEHVLAFASSFCKWADSHLACAQSETGCYTSQPFGKSNHHIRKVTGCSFVIFNASLKTSFPKIRVSIVEDGVMVQIKPELMETLRSKLLAGENAIFSDLSSSRSKNLRQTVESGDEEVVVKSDGVKDEKFPTTVEIVWENVQAIDFKLYSAVDRSWLGDTVRFRLSGRNVEISNLHYMIRLISIFALPMSSDSQLPVSWEPPENLYLIAQRVTVSLATCIFSNAEKFDSLRFRSVGIRFVCGVDTVEYSVGFDGKSIPDGLASTIDDYLIPVLGNISQDVAQSGTAKIELMLSLLRLW